MDAGAGHVSKDAVKGSIEIIHFVWDEIALRDINIKHCPIWNVNGALLAEASQILRIEAMGATPEFRMAISTKELDAFGRHDVETRLRLLGDIKSQVARHYNSDMGL